MKRERYLTGVLGVMVFIFVVRASFIYSEENNNTSSVKEFPHDLYDKTRELSGRSEKEKDKGVVSSEPREINININIGKEDYPIQKESVEVSNKVVQEYKSPPEDVSKNPENLLWYYLERWINDDYKAMYGALAEDVQKKYSFKKFYDLYQRDRDVKGGLEHARFLGELKKRGPYMEVWIELNYRNENVKPNKVLAVVQYTSEGYRVKDCGLIPPDYEKY